MLAAAIDKEWVAVVAAVVTGAFALIQLLVTRRSKKDDIDSKHRELDLKFRESMMARVKELEAPLYQKLEALEAQNERQAQQLEVQAAKIERQSEKIEHQAQKIERLEKRLREETAKVQQLTAQLSAVRRRQDPDDIT